MAKKIREFTVRTKEWARGALENEREAALRVHAGSLDATTVQEFGDTGTMCCLGFLGEACGYTPEAMLAKGMPSDLSDDNRWNRRVPKLLRNDTTESILDQISVINDNKEINDKVRKDRLRRAFKKAGVTIRFAR